MKSLSTNAIFILWKRDIARVWRFKSELFGQIMMPLMFLVFMGFGFSGASLPGIPTDVKFISFLVPGIIGMNLLFNSMFGGMDVLWDNEMGFLKEIMISPVSRFSIFVGRMAASTTLSLIQAFMVLFISLAMGFKFPNLRGTLIALAFMILTSFTFTGLGLAIASRMKNLKGFPIIMNFLIFPLFFISGAFYPIGSLPAFIRPLVYLDPLTYGVDGMRYAMINVSLINPVVDFVVLTIMCTVVMAIGSFLFERSEIGQ